MKNMRFLGVLLGYVAIGNAVTVQEFLRNQNVSIVIHSVSNGSNSDITIEKPSDKAASITVPANTMKQWNYIVPIDQKNIGKTDFNMASNNFSIKGWNDLGDNVNVDFFMSVNVEDNKVERVKAMMRTDHSIHESKGEMVRGHHSTYLINLIIGKTFSESDIQLSTLDLNSK